MTALHVIGSRERDLGGFTVRRVLPHARGTMIGPFIFFDHLGPAQFAPGTGIDVRPHPHIALATVTYLFSGATREVVRFVIIVTECALVAPVYAIMHGAFSFGYAALYDQLTTRLECRDITSRLLASK